MGADPVTAVAAPPNTHRRRVWLWAALALLVIVAVGALSSYLTATRPGGRMDPAATESNGAHALVALLRDHGVNVVIAEDVADVEREAQPDSLLLFAETEWITGADLLRRLGATPGDLLLVDPTAYARAELTPDIRQSTHSVSGYQPDCALHEANQAGQVDLQSAVTYATDRPATSCYGGALLRYHDGGRTITVVGTSYFMTNTGLLKEGNAALAMNLTGARPRLIWYAPQHIEGAGSGSATLSDLIPDNVTWMIWQLCLAVVLVALWKGRRIGPLVAEELPVVVRASETVEGRGRLYRSRRARDRAAEALRTATLQRLLSRLGLGATAPPATVVMTVAQRGGSRPESVQHTLFGPTRQPTPTWWR